jgi:hypothetical protein
MSCPCKDQFDFCKGFFLCLEKFLKFFFEDTPKKGGSYSLLSEGTSEIPKNFAEHLQLNSKPSGTLIKLMSRTACTPLREHSAANIGLLPVGRRQV